MTLRPRLHNHYGTDSGFKWCSKYKMAPPISGIGFIFVQWEEVEMSCPSLVTVNDSHKKVLQQIIIIFTVSLKPQVDYSVMINTQHEKQVAYKQCIRSYTEEPALCLVSFLISFIHKVTELIPSTMWDWGNVEEDVSHQWGDRGGSCQTWCSRSLLEDL